MVYIIKLFNQMFITVLIEEHLSKPTQFGKPSNLIGLDTGTYYSILIGQDISHLFSERGGDFDL